MQLVINIKQKSKFKFVEELLSAFGFVEISKKNEKQVSSIKEGDESVDPNMLFGKWKDLDIDAKELRKISWRRA
jgi:hypothetical protein